MRHTWFWTKPRSVLGKSWFPLVTCSYRKYCMTITFSEVLIYRCFQFTSRLYTHKETFHFLKSADNLRNCPHLSDWGSASWSKESMFQFDMIPTGFCRVQSHGKFFSDCYSLSKSAIQLINQYQSLLKISILICCKNGARMMCVCVRQSQGQLFHSEQLQHYGHFEMCAHHTKVTK